MNILNIFKKTISNINQPILTYIFLTTIVIIGIILMIVMIKIDIKYLYKYALHIFLFCVVLLILVLVAAFLVLNLFVQNKDLPEIDVTENKI